MFCVFKENIWNNFLVYSKVIAMDTFPASPLQYVHTQKHTHSYQKCCMFSEHTDMWRIVLSSVGYGRLQEGTTEKSYQPALLLPSETNSHQNITLASSMQCEALVSFGIYIYIYIYLAFRIRLPMIEVMPISKHNMCKLWIKLQSITFTTQRRVGLLCERVVIRDEWVKVHVSSHLIMTVDVIK